MSRALLVPMMVALCFWARAVHAQDDATPPAPEDAPPPEPYVADAPRAPEEPAASPAAPPPERRYDGQIGAEGGGTYDDEQGAAQSGDAAADGGGGGGGFSMPGFSIRIDPFNWLIEGRLGLELEVVVWKFISVELVPVFVANTEPPSFNLSGRHDSISQHSNGLGPISGASLGAGFWLSGTPLRGYVLRAILTDYNYTYEAADGAGVFDRVSHADRRFIVMIGSHSRFSFFTLAAGFGLGYELNQGQRCIVNPGSASVASSTSGCPDDGELQIKIDREDRAYDLNGSFHPVYLVGRISLGVSFD